MIRFSAFLVVVAVGILVTGGITSKLLLVYIAIALSAVALLFLLIGAFRDRDELRAPAEAALAGADERRAWDRARSEVGGAAAAAGIGTAGEDRTPAADRPAEDRPTEGWPAKDRPAEDTAAAGDRDDAGDDAGDAGDRDDARDDAGDAGDRDDAGDGDDAAGAGIAGSSSSGDSSGADRSLDRERSKSFAYRDELVYRDSTGFQSPESPGRPGRYRGPQTSQDPPPGQHGRSSQRPGPGDPGPSPDQTSARSADPAGAPPEPVQARSADPAGAPPEPVPTRPDPSGTRPEGLPAPGHKPAETRADLTVELAFPASGQPGLSEQPTVLEQPTALQRPAGPQQPAATGQPTEPPEPSQTAEPRPPQATDPETERAEESGPASEAGPSHDHAPSAEAEPPGAQGNGSLPDHHEVTVVPGVPRYHKSECILIRFMGDGDLQKMTVAAARDAGCTPCRACQPDGAEAD